MWEPSFACPECRCPVEVESESGRCSSCATPYGRRGGIHRFLTAARAEAAEPFQQQYRAVRTRDGYRSDVPEYYRMLPMVRADDPRAAEWRIRRESYAHLQQHALPAGRRGPIRVLDLGAGNGWLSHRVAALGHHAVAVDLLDDQADGLGACRHYPVPLTVVQADFDVLPFESGQFDVVVLNGSLHYAEDPNRTLREARRVLIPGGVVVVMDSPMFRHEKDGRAMVERQLAGIAADHGVVQTIRRGVGFLTYERLHRTARDLGLSSRFIPSWGPFAWRWRRRLARLRLHRAPAAFGVWMAQ